MPYNDPYAQPQISPILPGGFSQNILYQVGLGYAQDQGWVSPNSIFLGGLHGNAYDAYQRRLYGQMQTARIQGTAQGQADEWFAAVQGAFQSANRTMTPELEQGLRTMLGTVSQFGVNQFAAVSHGRDLLDTFSGGISSTNIAMALGSATRNVRDPLMGSKGLSPSVNTYVADQITAALRQENAGVLNSRGFSGNQLGQIMSMMETRGELPRLDAAFQMAKSETVRRVLDSGLMSTEDMYKLGHQYDPYAQYMTDAGMRDASGLHGGSIGEQAMGLRQLYAQMAAVSPPSQGSPSVPGSPLSRGYLPQDHQDSVAAYVKELDFLTGDALPRVAAASRDAAARRRPHDDYVNSLEDPLEAFISDMSRRDTQGNLLDVAVGGVGSLVSMALTAPAKARLWAAKNDQARAVGAGYDDLDDTIKAARMLEYGALIAPKLALQDMDSATMLSQALKAARNSDWEALAATPFGQASEMERLKFIADLSADGPNKVSNLDVRNVVERLSEYELRALGSNYADPFSAGFMQHEQQKLSTTPGQPSWLPDVNKAIATGITTATDPGGSVTDASLTGNAEAIYADYARRMSDMVSKRVASLSAVRDILNDDGLQHSEAELFELLDELTQGAGNATGNLDVEMALRNMDILSNQIGYNTDELRQISALGGQIAGAAGLQRPQGMYITERLLTGKQALHTLGVNNLGIYGMANEEQMAQAGALATAAALRSEDSMFLASMIRLKDRGLDFDTSTEEGRALAAYVGGAQAGKLTPESQAFASRTPLGELIRIAGQTIPGYTASDVIQEMSLTAPNLEALHTTGGARVVSRQNQLSLRNNVLPELMGRALSPAVQGLTANMSAADRDAFTRILASGAVEGYAGLSMEALRDTHARGQTRRTVAADMFRSLKEQAKTNPALMAPFANDSPEQAIQRIMQSLDRGLDTFEATAAADGTAVKLEEAVIPVSDEALAAEDSVVTQTRAKSYFESVLSDGKDMNPLRTLAQIARGQDTDGMDLVRAAAALTGLDVTNESFNDIRKAQEALNAWNNDARGRITHMSGRSGDAARAEYESAAQTLLADVRDAVMSTPQIRHALDSAKANPADAATTAKQGAKGALNAAAGVVDAVSGVVAAIKTATIETASMDNVAIYINGEQITSGAKATVERMGSRKNVISQ